MKRIWTSFIKSPYFHYAFVVIVLIVCSSTAAFAQESSATVQETADKAFKTIYKEWRWPICTLAMIPAAAFWFSRDPNGRKNSLLIVTGIIIFALIPYFVSIFKQWTNS